MQYAHSAHIMSRITIATNLTLSSGVKEMAKQLQKRGGHKSLTSLVEELIRNKHTEVFGPGGIAPSEQEIKAIVEKTVAQLNESSVPYRADNPPSKTGDTTKPAAEKRKRGHKPK